MTSEMTPLRISADLTAPSSTEESSVDALSLLSPSLRDRLSQALNVTHLFPVQSTVLPLLLATRHSSARSSPGDVCVSAPTGSGKTLAYALPIVESLADRVVPRTRALIVLPTRDLATQVRSTFEALCKGGSSGLKVVLLTGQSGSMASERRALFSDSQGRKAQEDGEALADIVIATPGRLLDHLNNSNPKFILSHLRFLVIDEADRLLSQSFQDWLPKVLESAQGPVETGPTKLELNHLGLPTKRIVPQTLRYKEFASLDEERTLHSFTPLQKLVFSATLTSDPTQLAALKLYRPQFISAQNDSAIQQVATAPTTTATTAGDAKSLEKFMQGQQDTLTSTFTLPPTLTEYQFVTTAQDKPLALFYLIFHLDLTGVLVFTRSVESAHRLSYLLQKFTAHNSPSSSSTQTQTSHAFSSDLPSSTRTHLLTQFKSGSIRVLFCSDVMARGMDLGPSVKTVINFDVPSKLLTYIHRVGRCARAGRDGLAYTLLEEQQVKWFKMVISGGSQVNRGTDKKVGKVKLNKFEFEKFRDGYVKALGDLEEVVKSQVKATEKMAQDASSSSESDSSDSSSESSSSVDDETTMDLESDNVEMEDDVIQPDVAFKSTSDATHMDTTTAPSGWWGKDWT